MFLSVPTGNLAVENAVQMLSLIRRNCVARLTPCIVLAILSAMECGAATLGHWRFLMTNMVDGASIPADAVFTNLVDSAKLPARLYAGAKTDEWPASYTNVVDRRWNAMRDGKEGTIIYNGEIGAVRTSGHPEYRISSDSKSGRLGCADGYGIEIFDPDGLLKRQTFTLELIVRIPTDGWTYPQSGRALFSMASGMGGHAYVMAARPSWNEVCGTISGGDGQQSIIKTVSGGGEALSESEFHHIAFVVNDGKWSLYRDYASYCANVASGGNIAYGDAAASLLIGASSISNMFAQIDVAEARFSDSALAVDEMLRRDCTYRAQPGEPLIHLTFDGAFRSLAFPEMLSDDPTLGAKGEGGASPSFSDDVKAETCLTYDCTETLRKGNAYSLNCPSGKVTWAGARMLYGEPSFTVEFFLKCGLQQVRSSVVAARSHVVYGNTNRDRAWQFGISSDGRFCVQTDTDVARTAANHFWQASCETNLVTDGRWHHVAATWYNSVNQEDGTLQTNTVMTLYVDYNEVDCTAAKGTVHYRNDVDIPLYVGDYASNPNSLLAANPFDGKIDELRISKGVLPVSKFLCLKHRLGLRLHLR